MSESVISLYLSHLRFSKHSSVTKFLHKQNSSTHLFFCDFQFRYINISGLFSVILGKGPWPKLGKNDRLTSKLEEIKDIEHNKGSKIYPQNLVFLDCLMQTTPLKHKCLSIILIWVIVSHVSSSGL